MTDSVGSDYPKQQARIRELITAYRDLPNDAGVLGALLLEDTLKRADEAQASGDIVSILKMYQEMTECN